MADYPLTDAQIMQVAYRVRGLIRSESKSVPEVPMVDTLEGIESFPVVQKVGGISKYVRASVSLLSQPAWEAVKGYIDDLEAAIGQVEQLFATSGAAVEAVQTATDEANKATKAANSAASNAANASALATSAAITADNSAVETDLVREQALAAVETLLKMIDKGRLEIENMISIREMIAAEAQFVPTKLEVDYPTQITITNTVIQKIRVKVYPAYLAQNIIFQQASGDSVSVNPDGTLDVHKCGKSRINIIATNNTLLWQTIEIEVKDPDLRKTGTDELRFNTDGTLRLA